MQNKTEEFLAPNKVDSNIVQTPENPEDSKVIIDIKFQNRKTYLAFQEEFVTLVKNYYKKKLDDMNINDDMSNNRIRVSEKRVKRSDTFLVDTTPNFKNLKEPDDESTPTYKKSFGKSVLSGVKESEENPRRAGRNNCFNCDKDTHTLRDCPEPRNMRKVNKARNEFSRKELRYHDDNENEYGSLVPGVISDELRAVLGLSSKQIPLHVYRMRLFGYPPGWIEEAKVHNSGLSLFVEKDKKQLHPGADDGEMEEDNFKYDVQKIYDFPGFNAEPEHHFMDQYRMHNTPPMMPQHFKNEMIRSLGNVVNGYKKTKLKHTEIVDLNDSCINDNVVDISTDMEIEDPANEETLPPVVTSFNETPLPFNSDSKPPEPAEDGELSDDSKSESLDENELKEKRKELLAEIAESSVFLDTSSVSSTLNNTALPSFNHNQIDSTIIENSENENRDNCARDNQSSQDVRAGEVDATIYGCPVLPSFSPFNSLPVGDKFQEGVCDVIAFENLAESTGKYEKMKTLIKKVRNFQQEHQKD